MSTEDRAARRLLIVTVTYNSVDLMADFLLSLPSGAAGLDWRLIVADNASADDTVSTIEGLMPAATVVQMGRNAGYAAGINAAVSAAADRFDAVLVLNPDVRLGSNCARILLDALAEPGVGIAVPRLTDRNGELILSLRRRPSVTRAWADAVIGAERAGRTGTLGEVISDGSVYESSTVADWAEGSTQLISAACWAEAGRWDESFFLYSEETEYDLRAGDHGFRLRYVPEAAAVHLEGESGGHPALWSLLQMNRVRLYRRRAGRLAGGAFWLATLVREISRGLLGKETSRAASRALLSRRRWRQTPGPDFLAN